MSPNLFHNRPEDYSLSNVRDVPPVVFASKSVHIVCEVRGFSYAMQPHGPTYTPCNHGHLSGKYKGYLPSTHVRVCSVFVSIKPPLHTPRRSSQFAVRYGPLPLEIVPRLVGPCSTTRCSRSRQDRTVADRTTCSLAVPVDRSQSASTDRSCLCSTATPRS